MSFVNDGKKKPNKRPDQSLEIMCFWAQEVKSAHSDSERKRRETALRKKKNHLILSLKAKR